MVKRLQKSKSLLLNVEEFVADVLFVINVFLIVSEIFLFNNNKRKNIYFFVWARPGGLIVEVERQTNFHLPVSYRTDGITQTILIIHWVDGGRY